jgi:hypothetical protein
MEVIIKLAGSLGDIYRYGKPEQKLNPIRTVASNATLEGRKARLNLFPPFEVLAKNRGH